MTKKGDDDVCICQINGASQTVQHFYNPLPQYNKPAPFSNPTIGFSNSQVSISNGIMTCSLRRQMSMPNTPNYMDITSNSYYLLVASGTNDASSLAPDYHGGAKSASVEKFFFNGQQVSTTTPIPVTG